MTRGNIVLLSTDSRESLSKRDRYAEAARELGLAVREHPDRRTVAVLPCSDFLAVRAAWLCAAHGIPGSEPLAATVASQNSLAYRFLAQQGFPTLWWQIPASVGDLESSFDRPIIIKPDRGSGSFSRHPWGYRVFASLRAFRRFLERKRLMRTFLQYQFDPDAWTGPYLAMEYVPGDMYGVASVIGDESTAVYDTHGMRAMGDSMVIDRILFGERHRDMPAIARIAPAFASLGMRRTILYVQCVERAGRLYPIDINLRPGTMFDMAVGALRVPFYREALAYFLGRRRTMTVRWPARCVGVRRVPRALKGRSRPLRLGENAIPLVERPVYDAARPYDRGHAWPVFAVLCSSRREFDRKADKIIRDAVSSQRRTGR